MVRTFRFVDGDAEAGSPAVATASADPPANENAFVVPASWYSSLYPRRGGTGVVAAAPSVGTGDTTIRDKATRDRARSLLAELAPAIARSLGHPETEPDLAVAGRAYLHGEPESTPLGAAVVVAAMMMRLRPKEQDRLLVFADLWLVERGLEFAARAAVELMSVRCSDRNTVYGEEDPGPLRRPWSAAYLDQVFWRMRNPEFIYFAIGIAGRIRAALATVPDEVYSTIVDVLATYRGDNPHLRIATSFLAPTQTAWVDEDCAALVGPRPGVPEVVLMAAVHTPEQAAQIASRFRPLQALHSAALLTTFAEGVGPAATGALVNWLNGCCQPGSSSYWPRTAGTKRSLLSLLVAMPTDEAFQSLLDWIDDKTVPPAVREAADRFPARALRLLAAGGAKPAVGDLLGTHVLTHPEVVREVLPSLPEAAAERVRAIVAGAGAVTEAPVEALPKILVSPPWTVRRRARKPMVVGGLECPDEPMVVWAPGQRDEWRARRYRPEDLQWYVARADDETWKRRAEAQVRGEGDLFDGLIFFLCGPEELTRPLVGAWRPTDLWDAEAWVPIVTGRHDLAALPMVIDVVRRRPAALAVLLLPFASPEVAVLMAGWLARLRSVRPVALRWLTRHPAAAARALIPPALAKPGAGRRQAEQALWALAAAGHRDEIVTAAVGYGPQATEGIAALLATDPLDVLPGKMPKVPDWANPRLLPPVRLRDGSGALPAAAATSVVTMLAMSQLGAPYPGLGVVREACQPASLAEFGWSLFQRWQSAGEPSKENWVFDALGLIGDDETVRRLAPLVRAWPGEPGGNAHAANGLEVLASIGSDVALMHLYTIAERVRFKGFKERALRRMAQLAGELGLSHEQLADRTVPDCGLDPNGGLTLDYGPRRFAVDFDEQLTPFVVDPAGERRRNLPKPRADDDPELAPVAYQRFLGLKKDVRTIAADQVRRLEQAMALQRRWTGAEFRRFFVAHPLLWHIVRRLVWGRYTESGALVGTVRVAEDRTFADAGDELVTITDDVVVGVAHPLHLGETLPAWVELFADYEILQPFAQLGRDVYPLTEPERDATSLARLRGRRSVTGKLISLERRGWRQGWRRRRTDNAAHRGWMERDIPGGRRIVVDVVPGVSSGHDEDYTAEQVLGEIWVYRQGDSSWATERSVRFGQLDPVTVSEVIHDLRAVSR